MLKTVLDRLRSFSRERDGVAAVEFAVGAPMMIFALIAMTDVGLAINERMNLDNAARSGAEFVMKNVSDVDTIEDLVESAATGSYGEEEGDVESAYSPTAAASRWCECADDPGTTVSCTGTICGNNIPPAIYYQIAVDRTYNAILLPDIALSTQINVQVR